MTVHQECHWDKSLLVQAGSALHRDAEGWIPHRPNKYRCEVVSRPPSGISRLNSQAALVIGSIEMCAEAQRVIGLAWSSLVQPGHYKTVFKLRKNKRIPEKHLFVAAWHIPRNNRWIQNFCCGFTFSCNVDSFTFSAQNAKKKKEKTIGLMCCFIKWPARRADSVAY